VPAEIGCQKVGKPVVLEAILRTGRSQASTACVQAQKE
jgi:hypothetical protein